MREACIRAVTNGLGREPTQAEVRNIENRIRNAFKQAATENPGAWRALSPEEQMTEAGRRAAQDLIAEASKTKQRAERAILAADQMENYRHSQVAEGSDSNGVEALGRAIWHHHDERNGAMISLEDRANAMFALSYTQISEVFDMLNPGLWRRMTETIVNGEPITREAMRRDFTNALHGITDGVPAPIVEAAKRYHEAVEGMREQFNAAGGVIGKLEDWGSSHAWSPRLLERAGKDAFLEDMIANANRRRYFHEDGRAYTDAELRAFFDETWRTIVSDGWTKDEAPAPFPGGAALKANRGSHHRVIHLKPEAAYDMLSRYSELNIMESMQATLKRMARDIAAVEMFGPNPDFLIQAQLDAAVREGAQIDPAKTEALRDRADQIKQRYDYLAGNSPSVVRRSVRDAFQTLRNMQVWKLGGSAITSLTDMEGLYKVALQNRLNPVKVMLNSTLAWSPKSRRYARRLGLVLDTMIADLERISGENISARTGSAQIASGVIRASGLSFTTNARRLGFSMTMMDSIGHLTRQRQYADVSRLHENDYRLLAAKGIDQATWDIWRAARVETHKLNHTLLTPDSIMAVDGVPIEARREAAIKLLSIIRSEQDLAIITPGANEQVLMRNFFGKTQPGKIGGEIARSIFVFKSFAIALQMRNWQRSGFYHRGNLGRYAYMAQMIVTMAILGALANWVKDQLQGKDPRPMWSGSTDPETRSIVTRNWIHAVMAGGGLGVYGDFLFAEQSPSSQTTAFETAAGPVLGTAAGAVNLGVGNATQALAGEETEFGAESVRFARGNTPFANLPYTRALLDRAIWNELADMADPGATDRMVDRQYDRQRTEYWWSPSANPLRGEGPARAPDLDPVAQ